MAKTIYAALLLCLLPGCANWASIFRTQVTDSGQSQLLQKSPMSDDSVVLEISIINIPSNRFDLIQQLYSTLDTTRIDLEQRKTWDRNGLRVAVGGNSIPLEFEELLSHEVEAEESDENRDETKLAPRRRLQARSGKSFRIATRSVLPELTWFSTSQDGYRHGGSKSAAQPEFEVRSFAKGDGSVKLIVYPEIMFGEPKQVVTTSNASFRYEMKRDSISFPDLRLETQIQLGESLFLSAAGWDHSDATDMDRTQGMGRAFFQNEQGDLKLVVIRLAQSQKDDLFDNSQNSQPLESVTE